MATGDLIANKQPDGTVRWGRLDAAKPSEMVVTWTDGNTSTHRSLPVSFQTVTEGSLRHAALADPDALAVDYSKAPEEVIKRQLKEFGRALNRSELKAAVEQLGLAWPDTKAWTAIRRTLADDPHVIVGDKASTFAWSEEAVASSVRTPKPPTAGAGAVTVVTRKARQDEEVLPAEDFKEPTGELEHDEPVIHEPAPAESEEVAESEDDEADPRLVALVADLTRRLDEEQKRADSFRRQTTSGLEKISALTRELAAERAASKDAARRAEALSADALAADRLPGGLETTTADFEREVAALQQQLSEERSRADSALERVHRLEDELRAGADGQAVVAGEDHVTD